MVMNIRSVFARLAAALISENKKDSARRVIERCLSEIPDNTVPYDYFVVSFADGFYKLGEVQKANQIAEKLINSSTGKLAYYFSFPDKDLREMEVPMQEALFTLQKIGVSTKEANQENLAKLAGQNLTKYYDLYVTKVYRPE